MELDKESTNRSHVLHDLYVIAMTLPGDKLVRLYAEARRLAEVEDGKDAEIPGK